MNRSEIIHQKFIHRVTRGDLPYIQDIPCELSPCVLADIFECQAMSRILDIESRRLSAKKQSFYTIGSSGHEGNAVFGHVFRPNDPAFLHYRSCALLLARSKKSRGGTPLYDTLLSFVASRDDPISGGRHKVIGSKALWIPPQTSTIASHLPKAVGMAHALGLYKKVDHNDVGISEDGIVICSFGDASVNHSTALGAINTAAWASYQRSPMPIVFICEDNDIGISTHTPKNWVKENYSDKPGLKYIGCDGRDIRDVHRAALAAEAYVRQHRKPVFLHLKTIRLMGHAGSDIESTYHSIKTIETLEAQDPLLYTAAILHRRAGFALEVILNIYTGLSERIGHIAKKAIARPKLSSRNGITQSIWPPNTGHRKTGHRKTGHGKTVMRDTAKKAPAFLEKGSRNTGTLLGLAKHINLALVDVMVSHSHSIVFGEDVAKKGGVYGVTQGLFSKFGPARVINTVLDEQSILGLAIGLAHAGYLPIAEIQYLAYVHNAEDQIRGEAATLSFFSNGQFTNPMIVRIAGFAYQKGFGGHFHNDNSFTVFRDIPGIVVVSPSNGRDAAKILRECVILATEEQKVVIIIEPIALYMTVDLHREGDALWASPYESPTCSSPIHYGELGVFGSGTDLAIVSYANGYYLSRKAAKLLAERHALHTTLFDLRWLHPLPEASLVEALSDFDNILIVDECRRSGSVSEALVTLLDENFNNRNIRRVTAEDSFIPLADAAKLVLPSVEQIIDAARETLACSSSSRRSAREMGMKS